MCSFCNGHQIIYESGYSPCPICHPDPVCFACGGELDIGEIHHSDCLEEYERFDERLSEWWLTEEPDFDCPEWPVYPDVLLAREAWRLGRITALALALN